MDIKLTRVNVTIGTEMDRIRISRSLSPESKIINVLNLNSLPLTNLVIKLETLYITALFLQNLKN
jgi:hypothetical protein